MNTTQTKDPTLELGEIALLKHMQRWRRKAPCWIEFDVAFDHMSSLTAQSLSVKSPSSWSRDDVPPWFFQNCLELSSDLLEERHTLGWFHQHYHELQRKRSFRALKHEDTTTSTQLYTPAWLADTLVMLCQEQWYDQFKSSKNPNFHDPACGGGQLLLAALDWLYPRLSNASLQYILGHLHGCDLDTRAVEATIRGLALRFCRHRCGADLEACLKQLRSTIVVADGLTHTPKHEPDIVLSNPPYMGVRTMPEATRTQLREHWQPFHGDLYVTFMARCLQFEHAVVGLLAQQTIWYLKRFKKARAAMLKHANLDTMIHLGTHAFRSLSGEKANVALTIHTQGHATQWINFLDLRQAPDLVSKHQRVQEAMMNKQLYQRCHISTFEHVPGTPLVYWLPKSALNLFGNEPTLGELAIIPGSQNKTGQNARFIKNWKDVTRQHIAHTPLLGIEQMSNEARWRFYSKGGRFAPWWGNWQHVVDWSDAAQHFYQTNRTSNLLAAQYWDRPGLCYTDFGGQHFNARWMPRGCVFDMAGPAIFAHDDDEDTLLYWLALLNSSAVREILNALNPSIHYQVSDLRNLPVPQCDPAHRKDLIEHARQLRDGYRALHHHLEDDPLFKSKLSKASAQQDFAELQKVWCALNAQVCTLYHAQPVMIDVPIHHAFKHYVKAMASS